MRNFHITTINLTTVLSHPWRPHHLTKHFSNSARQPWVPRPLKLRPSRGSVGGLPLPEAWSSLDPGLDDEPGLRSRITAHRRD
eukprot:scaffold32800_cov17-Prasinocladus_malaysianus.AAC.1